MYIHTLLYIFMGTMMTKPLDSDGLPLEASHGVELMAEQESSQPGLQSQLAVH